MSGLHLYAIQADGDGLIKIGSTIDVRKRLKILRANSPVPLDLLGVMPDVRDGEGGLEGMVHEILRNFREHGEWFRPEEPVLDLIREWFERPEMVGMGVIC